MNIINPNNQSAGDHWSDQDGNKSVYLNLTDVSARNNRYWTWSATTMLATIINILYDTIIIIYAIAMTVLPLFIIGYIVVYLYQATTPSTPHTPALHDAAATPVTDTHD